MSRSNTTKHMIVAQYTNTQTTYTGETYWVRDISDDLRWET